MKKLLILAAWLLAGCATAHTSARNEFLAHRRSVTRLGAFNGSAIPAAYHRNSDVPGFVWVLWSREGLCLVDASVWFTTRVGDLVSCEWRMPR